MRWDPYPPLPASAIRDLLGIARALYLVARESAAPDAARLEALQEVGRTLRAVLQVTGAPPGTILHGDGWMAAERAVRQPRELVAAEPALAGARRCTRPTRVAAGRHDVRLTPQYGVGLRSEGDGWKGAAGPLAHSAGAMDGCLRPLSE